MNLKVVEQNDFGYHTVTNPNGTVYVRSNADGTKNNNIE